jgi:predicted nucleic acid-binding Zn ribbon protein
VAASLPEAARLMGAHGAIELAAVTEIWPEIVGEQVAQHAWPKALVGGVLTVAADHHAWATELRFFASEVLKRLGPRCPAVRSIVVVVSPRPPVNW